MAQAFVVIGVGGGGRGVVNWVKKRLASDPFKFTNPVHLLVLDGPEKDQYILPGDFQIDTSVNSDEFYQFTQSPVHPIQKRADGYPVPYIDAWLTPEDARRVPAEHINPRDGYGMTRIAGRTGFFQEVVGVDGRIKALLHKAVTSAGGGSATAQGAVEVFIVGSFSGGTGAGMLIDVAHLVRDRLSQQPGVKAHLMGILFMPNSYGRVFSTVDEQVARDARSFAALRELMRAQGAQKTRIQYAHNITVANGQLFDICYLIDGVGERFQLGNTHPRDGVCAAAADFILAWVKNAGVWSANVAGNRIPQIANLPAERRFASFGIHSFIFPQTELMETLALRFAVDLYNHLIEPPPDAADEGRKLAEELLNGIKFTQLAVFLQQGHPVYERPPVRHEPRWRDDLLTLIRYFAVGGDRYSFPHAPMLELYEVVPTDKWYNSIRNNEVIQRCDEEEKRYLGPENSDNRQQVYGFLRHRSNEIASAFADALIHRVRSLFYDPKTNQPIPLNVKPHRLVILREFLHTLDQSIDNLRAHYQHALRHYDEKEDVIGKQKRVVDQLQQAMQRDPDPNGELQRQYVGEREMRGQYQIFMELKIWRIVLNACIRLLDTLDELVGIVDQMVGRTTYAWLNYLERDCRDALLQRLNALTTMRGLMAESPVRTYFPMPNDGAEEQIYRETVIGSTADGATPAIGQMHENLLKAMAWEFYATVGVQREWSPREKVAAYRLILSFPKVANFDLGKYQLMVKERLRNVQTGAVEWLTLYQHSPDAVVQYARNQLQPFMDRMTIWDALAYDFLHNWLPAHKDVPQDQAVAMYVEQYSDLLVSRSVPILGHTDRGQSTESFTFGDFNPQVKEIALQIAQAFSNLTTDQRSNPALTKELIRVASEYGVDINQWSYLGACHSNYRRYLSDLPRRTDYVPPSVCPEERFAAQIEGWLEAHRLLDPVRPLHPTVVAHLKDAELFTLFSLVYANGQLPMRKSDDPTKSDVFVIDTGRVGGAVVLGEVWNMHAILTRFFDEPEVPPKVQEIWQQHLNSYNSDFARLKADLQRAAQELQFHPVPTGEHDEVNRDDLRLAMQAAIYLYTERLRI
ncbi:MAG: hypothetical protein NZM10_04075 [Fimbriimonadales bacterium]|nr:hypothetical protein [Fimbriimonadales bacterium]